MEKGTVYSSKQKSVVLSVKFNMRNAIIWFMEAKFFANKVKPPEEIDLKLPHKTFAVFKQVGNAHDS